MNDPSSNTLQPVANPSRHGLTRAETMSRIENLRAIYLREINRLKQELFFMNCRLEAIEEASKAISKEPEESEIENPS